MKFNVDGVVKGCPGSTGFEGILRDPSGEVKATFFKSVGMADSNLAEIRAKTRVFLIFLASTWNEEYHLVIESDSINVVKWTEIRALHHRACTNGFYKLNAIKRCGAPEINREFPLEFRAIWKGNIAKIIVAGLAVYVQSPVISQLVHDPNKNFSHDKVS
ncbi:Uncharacterized protein TCM_022983 [Theobroma cacao]|uniref:RNase H type-1 domain-containing protein n=1 Tax=Theobroma cacao TaxID=3641 RepID=A0A061EUL2_THECC|nr:Uncharacterized protein TCM_022983 [Theobroma cacao]